MRDGHRPGRCRCGIAALAQPRVSKRHQSALSDDTLLLGTGEPGGTALAQSSGRLGGSAGAASRVLPGERRSEERRVGKECGCRGWVDGEKNEPQAAEAALALLTCAPAEPLPAP